MSLQPLTRRKERCASSIPTPTQRRTIRVSFQFFTRPHRFCTTEIIDSMALVQLRLRASPSLRKTEEFQKNPSACAGIIARELRFASQCWSRGRRLSMRGALLVGITNLE